MLQYFFIGIFKTSLNCNLFYIRITFIVQCSALTQLLSWICVYLLAFTVELPFEVGMDTITATFRLSLSRFTSRSSSGGSSLRIELVSPSLKSLIVSNVSMLHPTSTCRPLLTLRRPIVPWFCTSVGLVLTFVSSWQYSSVYKRVCLWSMTRNVFSLLIFLHCS